jgi:hypothetical protein
MPVVDAGPDGSRRGVYAAVREAVEVELTQYAGAPAAYERWAKDMAAGRPVAVPAFLVPAWARPKLVTGHAMLTALVAPDDSVSFRAETGAELVAWLGI